MEDVLIPPVFSFRCEDGLNIPQISLPSSSDSPDFYPEDDSVVLCSYPASGEDILLRVVSALTKPLVDSDSTFEDDFNPNGHETCYRTYQKPVVSHLPFCERRFNPRCKYILILRNPKQVCVSYYYLYKKVCKQIYGRLSAENCSFNTFFRLFVHGKVAFGDYFTHTKSWLESRCIPGCACPSWESSPMLNLLVVTHEDLESDLEHNMKRVAEFLEVQVTCEVMAEVGVTIRRDSVQESTGGNLKKMGLSGGWESHLSKERRREFEVWIDAGNESVYNRFWFDAF